MVDESSMTGLSRRSMFQMIGAAAGGAAMYQAMMSLGHAAPSTYTGPIKLEGDPKGTSVLVLGCGVAGMTAAYELRKAGYKVRILEYQNRTGGRSWSIYGGDTYTELGGATQKCEFDSGLYINPGPWRIPYHHTALLSYCREFGIALEPFIMVNYNAYIHSTKSFGGKPQRFREIQADFNGHIAELLAKATSTGKLDQTVSKEDAEILMAALRQWGALDKDYRYVKGDESSERRGYAKRKGGGLTGEPTPSEPIGVSDILKSEMWASLIPGMEHHWQNTIFQPVGGMGMVGKGFGKQIADLVTFNAKVTSIHQDGKGVTVNYVDATTGGNPQVATADWCVCTIPTPVLSQIEMQVGNKLSNAIAAVPYASAVKTGLQFKRRFWEQDEQIYGGISFTDLPIGQIGYPSTNYFSSGKGVLLGTFITGTGNGGLNPVSSFRVSAMSSEERVKFAVKHGAAIHPQYETEFENGISVAWHRVPTTLGCASSWTDESRAAHYKNLCEIDGRIALAGEHASYVGGWQEGGILSAHDAITRIHQRVMSS
jgi:monoamine oxidase